MIKLPDIFNRRALAEKRKEISALALKLNEAESKIRALTAERQDVERMRNLINDQMSAFAKDHMPTAYGNRYKPPSDTMRVVFDFEWSYWHRCPEILKIVGERVLHEALRKCDSWRPL